MYTVKNCDNLLEIDGFSENLFKTHFKLYSGYVSNTNKLIYLLKSTAPGTPEYAELKRRFGWEYNGMRLHELYFDQMNKNPIELSSESILYKSITENFGSFENWKNDFISTACMRGIGWVILYRDIETNKLFNCWINEHDLGHPAGAIPVLILDVFEHAFITDFGLDRKTYIESFFNAIDWKIIENR